MSSLKNEDSPLKMLNMDREPNYTWSEWWGTENLFDLRYIYVPRNLIVPIFKLILNSICVCLPSLLVVYELTNIISCVGELNCRHEHEDGKLGIQKIRIERKQGRSCRKCHLRHLRILFCHREELIFGLRIQNLGRALHAISTSRRGNSKFIQRREFEAEHSMECQCCGEEKIISEQNQRVSLCRALTPSFDRFDFSISRSLFYFMRGHFSWFWRIATWENLFTILWFFPKFFLLSIPLCLFNIVWSNLWLWVAKKLSSSVVATRWM